MVSSDCCSVNFLLLLYTDGLLQLLQCQPIRMASSCNDDHDILRPPPPPSASSTSCLLLHLRPTPPRTPPPPPPPPPPIRMASSCNDGHCVFRPPPAPPTPAQRGHHNHDSRIPSQVPDSQPAYDTKVAVTPLPSINGHVADLVAQESDTINLDGPPEKACDPPEKVTAGKTKRGAFADDDLVAFTNMTIAVKDVAQAIRDNKPTDMHPDMYNAVMDMLGFFENDLMAALSHLVDH
nr:formin-like protein 20 [Lolium perenne]